MQDTDRSASIRIGSEDYQLILTTRATKEIAKRYGGLENLGVKLMKTENFEMALDEVVWLIALLANQSRTAGNRLKGQRGDKPGSPGGHHHLDLFFITHKEPGQLRRLVSSDTASNPQ